MIKFSAFTLDHRLKRFEFEDPSVLSEVAREEMMTPRKRGFYDGSLFFDMECGDHRVQGEFERSTLLKTADAADDFFLWTEAFRSCEKERSRLHSPKILIDSWTSETGRYTKSIVFISETARTKGILALEPVAKSLEGDKRPGFGILYNLAILMVDGTDPVLVDELFTTGYWMNQPEGIECLTSLLVRKGILAIQAKENPYIIAEKLKAHLPYSEKSDTGETVMAYVNKALSQLRMTANSLVK